jgi:hypothetical protein
MAFLKEQGARQCERLLEVYENETYKAVTINEYGLNHFEATEKEVLERWRIFHRAKAAGLVHEDETYRPDDKLSQEDKMDELKAFSKYQAQLPDDEFKREIDVAAKVRAYYLTAATRFVDSVSMDINSRLFRYLREGKLDQYLGGKLGLFYPSELNCIKRRSVGG